MSALLQSDENSVFAGSRKALRGLGNRQAGKKGIGVKKKKGLGGGGLGRRKFGDKLNNNVMRNGGAGAGGVGGAKKVQKKKAGVRRARAQAASGSSSSSRSVAAEVECAPASSKVLRAEKENAYDGGVNLSAALGALQMGSRAFEHTAGEAEFADLAACGVDRGFEGWGSDSVALDGVEVTSLFSCASTRHSSTGTGRGGDSRTDVAAGAQSLADLSFDDLSSSEDEDEE